jgi:hypothetical protein
MTIADLRTGVATALRTISKLRASEYVLDQPVVPHAMFDFEIEPDLTFGRGADVYKFTGWVLVDRASERQSQVWLDQLRDPNNTAGIKYTLENDATLAAACDYARVTRIGRVEPKPHSGIEYLGFDFDFEVVL